MPKGTLRRAGVVRRYKKSALADAKKEINERARALATGWQKPIMSKKITKKGTTFIYPNEASKSLRKKKK